jgi:hypothetical protein
MKRLFIRILVFILLFFALMLGYTAIKISDEYIVHKYRNTSYEKVAWNISKINSLSKKDSSMFSFFGPSFAQGGISDSILNSKGIYAVNFGCNHPGKELELYFIERLLKVVKPKEIIQHTSSYGAIPQGLHLAIPALVNPYWLVSRGQSILNYDFFYYFIRRIAFVTDYLLFVIKGNYEYQEKIKLFKYGWRPEHLIISESDFKKLSINTRHSLTESDSIILNRGRINGETKNLKNEIKWRYRLIRYSDFWRNNFENKMSQRNFMNRAKTISAERAVTHRFIHIPMVVDSDKPYIPIEMRNENVIYLTSTPFLSDNEMWADAHHLSLKGSLIYTDSISCLIKNY